MDLKLFFQKLLDSLASKHFKLNKQANLNSFRAELLAVKEGKGFFFLPYVDYYFFYKDSLLNPLTAAKVARLHELDRIFANSQFKWPKALRIKIPNIVTVIIAEGPFPKEAIDLALKATASLIGGERHQIVLIDLLNKQFFCQAPEVYSVYGLTLNFKKINSLNRPIYFLKEILMALADFNFLDSYLKHFYSYRNLKI